MKTVAYLILVAGACGLGLLALKDILADLRHSDSSRIEISSNPDRDVHSPEESGTTPPPETQSPFQHRADAVLGGDYRIPQAVAETDNSEDILAVQPEAEFSPTQKLSIQPAVSADPVRQQTQLHPTMITPGNFVYLGGFRPEFGDGNGSRFGYGGGAITYRPDGDPEGPDDGFPGSLFLMGHAQQQLIAEVNIPSPFVSSAKNIDQLPKAKMLQPLSDVTSGLRNRLTNGSSEPFEIGGLQVVGNRLHWTVYKYYNVDQVDYLSHGLTTVDLSNRAIRGLWHLGPHRSGESRWHSYKNAGYIASIPDSIANRYLRGKNLMSGLQISTGRQTSSQGPALYAYRIDNEDLPSGSSLDATPLLWYPMNAPMTGHHPADSWQGAAWLTLGSKQAVIVVGRKGLGPVYYGLPRPGDCYQYKGYHASQYEVQILFYPPEQILAGARQRVPNKDPWYQWNSQTPGGSLNRFMFQDCGKEIGGIAYDRQRNLLYISEMNASLSEENEFEPLPVIHVLRIVE